jgi:hypothetical protein
MCARPADMRRHSHMHSTCGQAAKVGCFPTFTYNYFTYKIRLILVKY